MKLMAKLPNGKRMAFYVCNDGKMFKDGPDDLLGRPYVEPGSEEYNKYPPYAKACCDRMKVFYKY